MSEEKMREAFEGYLAKGGSEHFDIYANVETFAAGWQAALQESEAGAGDCVCGEPESPNTVHRSDGPCYQSSQECEAGTVAAYVMKAQLETMKRCGSVYVHLRSCLGQQVRPNSEYTALFAAPPSAQAIETAAIMRAAEAVACPGRTIFDTEKAILALIPKDGRTELEEFGMKVATETRSAVLINTREDLFTEDSSLRAIVTNLIGAAK